MKIWRQSFGRAQPRTAGLLVLATGVLGGLGAGPASAATGGQFANACIARAVQAPAGTYASLQSLNQSCGLPTAPATTADGATVPAAGAAPAGSVSPDDTPGDYGTYYIYSGDGANVINAKGCSINTVLITYPVSSACNNGGNEKWELTPLSDGYRALIADYGGYVICMQAGPSSGQNGSAGPCTNPKTSDPGRAGAG
jgi:hypothetical protein